ncbi:MAG TPA: hypothetical protein VK195_20155 [Burkholderiaceae bacterium]|nr:hypothetical protein [Burkholderiaceae bacterium]
MNTASTKHRPTGLDVQEYDGYKKWTFKRWAWEFLRRNPEFAKQCKAAGDDPAKQQAVADEFGLKRFKHYRSAYGHAPKPSFSDAIVTSWSWKKDQPREPKMRISRGQVIIRFDLSATIKDVAALEAQLRNAKTLLTKRQRTYLQEIAAPEPKTQRKKPMYFLQSLRLLDLMNHGTKHKITDAQAWMIVHHSVPLHEARTDTNALASQEVAKPRELAREMAASGYRHLANRSGRPNPKDFVGKGK